MIEEQKVMDFIDAKPEDIELILTGRYASKALIDKADLVTEMKNVKHPYDKGIQFRQGIEY